MEKIKMFPTLMDVITPGDFIDRIMNEDVPAVSPVSILMCRKNKTGAVANKGTDPQKMEAASAVPGGTKGLYHHLSGETYHHAPGYVPPDERWTVQSRRSNATMNKKGITMIRKNDSSALCEKTVAA